MYTAFLGGIMITVQISAFFFFFLMTKAGNSLKWDMKISVGSFPVPKHFLALNRLDRHNLKKKCWSEKRNIMTHKEERVNRNLKVWCWYLIKSTYLIVIQYKYTHGILLYFSLKILEIIWVGEICHLSSIFTIFIYRMLLKRQAIYSNWLHFLTSHSHLNPLCNLVSYSTLLQMLFTWPSLMTICMTSWNFCRTLTSWFLPPLVKFPMY